MVDDLLELRCLRREGIGRRAAGFRRRLLWVGSDGAYAAAEALVQIPTIPDQFFVKMAEQEVSLVDLRLAVLDLRARVAARAVRRDRWSARSASHHVGR